MGNSVGHLGSYVMYESAYERVRVRVRVRVREIQCVPVYVKKERKKQCGRKLDSKRLQIGLEKICMEQSSKISDTIIRQ